MRRALLLALFALVVLPAAASAHAQLISTQPARGAQFDKPPGTATMKFDEPVEGSFGAVRVFGPDGQRVDDGKLLRPAGDSTIGTRVRSNGEGVYTVTYRVISADGHPVSGGFTYSVGDSGTAPRVSVAELLDDQQTGTVTESAFGVVRAIGYLAIALAVGGLAFAALVWSRMATGREDSRAFERRLRSLLTAACVLGAVTTALAIVLQAAVAASESFWQALDPDAIEAIASTRTGTALAARLGAWLLLSAALALAARGWHERYRDALLATTVLAVTGLVMMPGLGGHAGIASPSWPSVIANSAHVAAMSVWVGGIAMLLLVLPAATRATTASNRSRLLYETVARFSPVALVAAAVVVVTGVAQSVIQVPSFADLVDTAFGRAILVKTAIVAVLVAIGALHRTRFIPRLRQARAADGGTGSSGRSLRTALRIEIVLMIVVLGVSAALVSYSPAPSSAGAVSESFDLGEARAEVSVSPLTRGPQEIHVYLFDGESGQPLRNPGKTRARLGLKSRGIGPIAVDLRRAGPGHFTATQTVNVAGDWKLTVDRRASRFDSYAHELELKIK